ncbi:MAG: potassium-transporting ATPase subunit KdpC [Firmicutes bacterium]|nr:potassium-transporting ATPase subunit KdpC [Bacillota bacterium]
MNVLRRALAVTLGLWVLFGLAYPLVITGVSGIVFPYQAAASPVVVNGRVVAAANVGQEFTAMDQFWGRPSATVSLTTGKPQPYNAENSAPSNLGPTNPVLIEHVRGRIAHLLATTPGLKRDQIPPDLVESSGSGLDPDISVQAALIQIPRVAKATGLTSARLRALVATATQGPDFGLFGKPVVNVVALNLALERALRKR